MGFVSHRAIRRPLRRRFVSAMLVAMYLVTAAGVPLPAGNVALKSGELFPCSDSACGCASAEKCWRSCCCHSLSERMAWARVHGVRPPEFAIAEARRARIDVAWLVDPTGSGSKSLCCARQLKAESPKCCHAKKSCCGDHHEQQPSESKSNRVIEWKALNCQGHSGLWVAAVPTLVNVQVDLTPQLPQITRLGPHTSEVAAGTSDVPTPPPPQRA
jgi:hypothetical protein